MWVICDIETEKLDNPEKIWFVVCKEVESGLVHVFRNVQAEGAESFRRFASLVSVWIGHNFCGFDAIVLNKALGNVIKLDRVIDTLVVSRMINFERPQGHSLESWGESLDIPKIHFTAFDKPTDEMLEYCKRDVEITYLLFKHFERFIKSPDWSKSLRLEHDSAIICEDIRKNGFTFDTKRAIMLLDELEKELETLSNDFRSYLKPKPYPIKTITPRVTKHGTLNRTDFRFLGDNPNLSHYSVDQPFTVIGWEEFNPGSSTQIVERLNEIGWKPVDKTKGHIKAEKDKDKTKLEKFKVTGWKVNETNLETIPDTAPQGIKNLARWIILDSRRASLVSWIELADKTTNRIHGSFFHIGAWTHRMSHANPNMANIPREYNRHGAVSPLGREFRELWTVPKGRRLIGVDADGIQLRILAHYMDDPKFTEALVYGDKKLGTDVHTLNQKLLGSVCVSRDVAKTFIFSWLLGAGVAKTAEVLGCTTKEAGTARDSFLAGYEGLGRLKNHIIPRDAARGYFQGLDGRLVMCSSQHLMLAGYLQCGEAIVMKWANRIWRERLNELGVNYKQVNFVHDEWQVEIDDDDSIDKLVSSVVSDSIRLAGEQLQVKCPLLGNSHSGYNWYQTH